MYQCIPGLMNEIKADAPDPAAANALQEGLGGQFGEMRTMMQYLFQAFNFRGEALAFRDLIHSVGIEEISHVELIATTIAKLVDGSPRFDGPRDAPAAGGTTPLNIALSQGNIHHYLVGAQGAMPVDAAGNPWMGSYVHCNGNLVLDLLDNLVLESTGRLQKCRLYEMTDNATARATISFLIVRDHAHENVFAKALESLGVEWNKVLPIPNFDASQYPEVKRLMDEGLHLRQHHFTAGGNMLKNIFHGPAPAAEGDCVATEEMPPAFSLPLAPERPEEYSPGLPDRLAAMAEQLSQDVADLEGITEKKERPKGRSRLR